MTRTRTTVAALAALFCVACSSGTPEAAPTPSTSQASTTEWNVESWKPSEPVTARTWSEPEKQAWRTSWLSKMAKDMGVKNPPKVELVRWITLEDDALAECVTQQGFPAKNRNGGLEFDGVSGSQESALNLAEYTCMAKYSFEPKYVQEWSPQQLGVLYDYWSEYLVPCLAAFGRPSSQEVPSREKFISSFHSPDRVDWNPGRVVESSTLPEDADMRAACPATPPAKYFYG